MAKPNVWKLKTTMWYYNSVLIIFCIFSCPFVFLLCVNSCDDMLVKYVPCKMRIHVLAAQFGAFHLVD